MIDKDRQEVSKMLKDVISGNFKNIEVKLQELDAKTHYNEIIGRLNVLDITMAKIEGTTTRTEVLAQKTNGRVTDLENEVDTIKIGEVQHLVNCPRLHDIVDINKKIDQLNEENLILKIWNKYPKQLLTFFIAMIVVILVTLGYTVLQIHKTINEVRAEQVTIDERR